MDDETDLQPDSPPSVFDPQEAKRVCQLSDLQFKWCMARLRGANKTQAAREAGYAGEDNILRSQAAKIAASKRVQAFLKWAETEGAGVSDEPGDGKELKRILWRHARGTDKPQSIRACEVLHKLEAADREAEAARGGSPGDLLKEIAEISPALAIALAGANGDESWATEAQRAEIRTQRRNDVFWFLCDMPADERAKLFAEVTMQKLASGTDTQPRLVASEDRGAAVG